jgi:V-type H+-transporting ATPase subunit a
MTLLTIVAICVPAMLFVKPIFLSLTSKSHHAPDSAKVSEVKTVNQDDEYLAVVDGITQINTDTKIDTLADKYDIRDNIVKSAGDNVVHSDEFGELMIHQLIETIEFVLGTVSNTASYLRLWALSLAHSQLAKVFFDNCLIPGFQSGSVITMFLGFFVFMGATLFVLMCMDFLECALHTLRLHWVEFQNKFFKGQGLVFAPVNLAKAVVLN